jgi:hypothetical protein
MAPLAFLVGVFVGLALASRYRIVRVHDSANRPQRHHCGGHAAPDARE